MKILDLALKAEWYDLIEKGEKKEEYREIKAYWIKRLTISESPIKFKHFDYVRFRYGYTKRIITFKIKEIKIGIGNPTWGGKPNTNVFIIKLGERLS